ncbi:MAG: Type 1 glutamine amidotransferase-like domain-containing protein [Lachnospiraceae bacterium]|nr:Type 1 glutamine amidotransferase-like domain-containing protein [Lachnospiraceae bacterium]
MNVLLTSCGLETPEIEKVFLDMLPKKPSEIRAVFVPTAAIYPDAIEVLHKCLEDLLRCGIKRENIQVYDLHEELGANIIGTYDVIYFCGGNPEYLLRRINEKQFRRDLMEFIYAGGVVLGVSAGSIIFADNMPNNLGLLQCPLDVHCSKDSREQVGAYDGNRTERIRLGNEQAIVFKEDKIIVFE